MTFLLLCFALYFAPALVASGRQHPSAAAIWFLNLLLGWTVLGWIACLVWALSVPRMIAYYPAPGYGLPVPMWNTPASWRAAGTNPHEVLCAVCGRPLAPAASFCGMCGANGRPSS